MMPQEGRYRDNVCVVVRRSSDKRLLLCHRVGSPPEQGWQFPQGGVHSGRALEEEMRRELREEIGTDCVRVLAVSPGWYQYDFPEWITDKPGYRGQRQRWFFTELTADDSAVSVEQPKPEFDDYRWVSPQEALAHAVSFKREVYRQALRDFGLL